MQRRCEDAEQDEAGSTPLQKLMAPNQGPHNSLLLTYGFGVALQFSKHISLHDFVGHTILSEGTSFQ
jgi:hypothetical protein